MKPGDWYYSEQHKEICQLIETHTIWGKEIHQVWLPSRNIVVRLESSRLKKLDELSNTQSDIISYIASAARISSAMGQDILLAPIESSVIPLPHQIRALSRAMSSNRIRYLLADEVGLGKTIEAGLILRELKLRGLVKRILIVTPKGLVLQWIDEMQTRFQEEFRFFMPSEFMVYRNIAREDNIWRNFNQIICSIDSVKPIDSRKGWSTDQIAAYNHDRFDDLISAGWDLIIVDEAHRLGGSTDQVARFKLGQGLAEAAPYLLLLSGTPHQGKTDSFHRILTLLDDDAFPESSGVQKERVLPYVIRTEKRKSIGTNGEPLFQPRVVTTEPVQWAGKHKEQRLLYDAVTLYVRKGYNQARKEKKTHIGFLLLLIQRLVASSTNAIYFTLERRLDALRQPEEQLSLFPMVSEEDWSEMDGQEQLDTLLKSRILAMQNERKEVEFLLEAAQRTMKSGPDIKAEALLDWIYKLQQEEGNPELKVLIFTEFVPTQEMLRNFLTERGFSVVCLNGSMDLNERKNIQKAFSLDTRILISTEAGGEGLNLQFCHIVVNYDLPWNPMRIEQRIGRVDRIGQKHPVRGLNLIIKDTVEYRVREVLEKKLAVILEEFGVDKTGDVLDTAEAEAIFDDLFQQVIIEPDRIEEKVETALQKVREQVKTQQDGLSLLSNDDVLKADEVQKLINHPLPYWVEKMTLNYVSSHGGRVMKTDRTWQITWPDGTEDKDIVFNQRDAEDLPGSTYINLEDAHIRGILMGIQRFARGQPIPKVKVAGLPEGVKGIWGLFRISLYTEDWNNYRVISIFLHDDGRVLIPTANHIWSQIMDNGPVVSGQIMGKQAVELFDNLALAAEKQGYQTYEDLSNKYQSYLQREKDKMNYGFSERKKIIQKVGLANVREHRLKVLEAEEAEWQEKLVERSSSTPELIPLIMIHVEDA
ncbi:MAG: helicase [Dehalococcoides mccartyi]|uniref:DEAD/DEAH box helicase n=1 Tax=Dehalococcoides mccartyi TaxID=61435 RepID=UPI000805CA02|nr:helicase-related protein [Dehalococcoides mccartyi]OBW63498.1 MAG: helicase [Dehalococcoides mccartyi]